MRRARLGKQDFCGHCGSLIIVHKYWITFSEIGKPQKTYYLCDKCQNSLNEWLKCGGNNEKD